MKSDAESFTRKNDKCQRFALIIHSPAELLSSVSSPYPFMNLGMDIMDPLPVASGQRKFILAITNYFSKWVETKAFAQVKEADVENFVWREVICRFSLPKEVVADNRTQFISDSFQDFYGRWKITLSLSNSRYPQSKSQAEATNKTILNNLKKKLKSYKVAGQTSSWEFFGLAE